MRRTWSLMFAALAVAACAARPPASPLAGPFPAPATEAPPPPRVALRSVPRGDGEWNALGDEAAALLSQYLRINTTNPPGNEIAAARWLAAVLRREGIESQTFEPAPGKANLYARLKGDGTARPLILLNHMDVVLASPEYWQVDPFGGVVKDGYVWGRGALDMKGEGIAQLMAFVILKRAGVPLKRDVIFLATSDEEIGAGVGAGWFAERHAELLRDAEFLLNEGGTTRANERGGVDYYGVGTTEKSPFWLDLTARGTAGHGSRPTPDNPVHRLVRALDRIAEWRTPLVVTPAVQRYFADLATIETDSVRRRWFADIRAALRDSAAVRAITADLTYNALLRNTISITGLKGSDKTNVIPPVATAALDVRLLPGQEPAAVLAELVRVVGDTAVTIRPQGPSWPATESSTETELFRAIETVAHARHPSALVTTPMLAGFTDSHYFRRLGIASYGIAPFPLTAADARGVHGNDERVSVDALRFGVRFVYDVVARVAAKGAAGAN
ncbi:MAG TPA: M20/M25/M40 family metallo-hydrolase [Gemmatimonadales bacterium]|nr:M20/M25/M40 family metallo-hydrolase [Gemmatimonadales bacterium]